ncbi:hypothetical protein Lal_00038021 [Lupinus albus]|nr:hypothetical protein Lal_00038021 [Lupinus albus]
MEGVEIDVVRLMATEIYKTAVKGGKKGTMGFPSLITSLCARQGVTVNPTEPIKKPITKQYIKQNCKEEPAESQAYQHHEDQVFLSPEEFTRSFPWPRVRPTFPGETAGAGEPSGSGADEDEEIHDEELL